jgi:hypothetical protein
MRAKPIQKIAFLRPGKIRLYKSFCLSMMIVFILIALHGFYRFIVQSPTGAGLPVILPGLVFAHQFYTLFIGIKSVEFDEEFLYVFEKGYEKDVPL